MYVHLGDRIRLANAFHQPDTLQESSLVSGLAAVHRFYEDRYILVAATMETVLFETLAVQTAASQQQEHL